MPPYTYVFPAEWDNLSVPLGPRQDGWVHLTPDHPCGIWGMAMSVRCAHPMGEVSSLNCVYLLAPCRENLPINCVLILSVNGPMIFLLSYTTSATNLWTSPLHFSSSHPLSLAFLFTSYLPPCTQNFMSQIHTHNHVTEHGFGDMWWWQWTALKGLQWWKTSQRSWESIFCFTPGKIYELCSSEHLCSPAGTLRVSEKKTRGGMEWVAVIEM